MWFIQSNPARNESQKYIVLQYPLQIDEQLLNSAECEKPRVEKKAIKTNFHVINQSINLVFEMQ
jgi:hypothetical protein